MPYSFSLAIKILQHQPAQSLLHPPDHSSDQKQQQTRTKTLPYFFNSQALFPPPLLPSLVDLNPRPHPPPYPPSPSPLSFSLPSTSISFKMFRSVVRKSSPLMSMSKAAAFRPAVGAVPRLGTSALSLASLFRVDAGGRRRCEKEVGERVWTGIEGDGRMGGVEGGVSKGA